MGEDAEVGSGTSSITRSAKNLSVSVDMAENVEFDKSDGHDDKTVKRSPLFKKLNVSTENLTSLCFGKKMSFPW